MDRNRAKLGRDRPRNRAKLGRDRPRNRAKLGRDRPRNRAKLGRNRAKLGRDRPRNRAKLGRERHGNRAKLGRNRHREKLGRERHESVSVLKEECGVLSSLPQRAACSPPGRREPCARPLSKGCRRPPSGQTRPTPRIHPGLGPPVESLHRPPRICVYTTHRSNG